MEKAWNSSIRVQDIDDAIKMLGNMKTEDENSKKALELAICALTEQKKMYPTGEFAEISKMMTFGSIHITEKTAELMDLNRDFNVEQLSSLSVYEKGDYGWIIYVPEYEVTDGPEDLLRLINIARENGCTWLCIDSDGPEVKDLPKYDW